MTSRNKKKNSKFNLDEIFRGTNAIVTTTNNKLNKKKSKNKKNVVLSRDVNQITLVEKHRPKTLSGIIGHEEAKATLRKTIQTGDLPHLLFYGPSGTGKTSMVKVLARQLYGPKKIHEKVLELNASDENGINVVRDKIINFANIVVGSNDPDYPSPSFKLIILDEADSMTSEAQTALKKVMESTCDITRFVIICNYESKIINAIKSRCADFRFNPIPNELMIKKLRYIADSENIIVDDDVLNVITEICDGDARRSINTLQIIKYIPHAKNKKVTKDDIYNITSFVKEGFYDKYWNKILNGNIKKISDITLEITNMGYPMNYLLARLKDKIIKSNFTDTDKSEIIIYIAKIERMITFGADNFVQLLALFAFINGTHKKLNINKPQIY